HPQCTLFPYTTLFRSIIQSKLNALQKLLADDQIKAKYKLEVLFGKARSTWKPTSGALTFWENGSKFHGGGDAKIYLCPGKLTGRSEEHTSELQSRENL